MIHVRETSVFFNANVLSLMASYLNQPGSQVQSSYPSTSAVPPTAVGYTTTTQHFPYLSSYPPPPPPSTSTSTVPPTAVGYTTTTQHVPYLSSYPPPPPYSYPPIDLPPLQPYPAGTLILNIFGINFYISWHN